jgi:hypothetical protein
MLAMYKRLEDLRSEMILRLSLLTKQNTDLSAVKQAAGFDLLDKQTTSIIQKLVEAPDELIANLDAQTTELKLRHDQSDALAVQLQQQTLAAIDNLILVSATLAPMRSVTPTGPAPEPISLEETRQKLIDILKFRHMFARQDEIAVAHNDTFHWILSEKAHSHGSFSPLLPWLREGDGAYWISGKPGSGKSTLMKFLSSNIEARVALKNWAHPRQLITASFYFWRSGTLLQRSQEGLLRWLLYTVLSQRRELVEICFPDDFDELMSGKTVITEILPTLELITKALTELSRAKLGTFRICLFIDGLDEFEGDHDELSIFFRNLASSPAFKIVLSSRPIPACEHAFKGLPTLRLQDLTQGDIQAYVEATVGRHERMDMLLSENKQEASKLIGMILSKASGVFLWVRLVVKSLLDGFRNYDRIPDLQQRVNEFPAELGDLYLHIFHSMAPRYQAHAAQLLRIIVHSIEVQKHRSLTVLQLSFAEDGSLSKAIPAPITVMREEERRMRTVAMAGRVQSRCCGLVEVRDWLIEVIHTSVLDFLALADVWGRILSMTPDVDPNAVLIAANLYTIKSLPPAEVDIDVIVLHYLRYCQLREKDTQKPQIQAIDGLKEVLSVRQPDALIKLPHRICLAGLSHYVSHCLMYEWKEERNLDIPTILVRIVEGIVDSSSRNHRFFSSKLNEEYIQISSAIIIFLSQSPDHTDGLKRAWMGTVKQIAIFYQDREWLDTKSEVDALNVLIAVVETFLDQGMDVNLVHDPWLPTDFGSETVADEGFFVSGVLLTWLGRLSVQFESLYDTSTGLEARIATLQEVIFTKQHVTDSYMKQEDWTLWLERVLPLCWFEEEPKNTRPPFAGSESSWPSLVRTIPGGPFELDSVPLEHIPRRTIKPMVSLGPATTAQPATAVQPPISAQPDDSKRGKRFRFRSALRDSFRSSKDR